ncbi:MAG: hypothetical protein LWW86_01280 [Micrococcales bacterium]|nr:hypothetical protein [Micrococcales bacterium]
MTLLAVSPFAADSPSSLARRRRQRPAEHFGPEVASGPQADLVEFQEGATTRFALVEPIGSDALPAAMPLLLTGTAAVVVTDGAGPLDKARLGHTLRSLFADLTPQVSLRSRGLPGYFADPSLRSAAVLVATEDKAQVLLELFSWQAQPSSADQVEAPGSIGGR